MKIIDKLWVAVATLVVGISADDASSEVSHEKIQVGSGRFAVRVGATRNFLVTLDTAIRLDGQPIEQHAFIQVGSGRVARFSVGSDVDDGIQMGTLDSIDIGSAIKGPVTSVEPFTVLDLPVVITTDTFLDDVPGNDIANLNVGDIVELDGFSGDDSSLQASRIEYEGVTVDEWEVTGFVATIDGPLVTVGPLTIDVNGVTPDDCDAGLTTGQYVEIKADPDSSYQSGSTLLTTSSIECISSELMGPPGSVVPATIQGLITALGSGGNFFIGDQAVEITPTTEFDDGGVQDIKVGANVEVEGVLDTDSGLIVASKVEFEEVRIRVLAPLRPDDVDPGGLTILQISVLSTPQTKDENDILTGSLSEERQIEVSGFVDSAGTVFAVEVKDEGEPRLSDVRLRGPVQSIDQPEIFVLGVLVDTSTSQFKDAAGDDVDADTFFAVLREGDQIEIEEGASYDPATNTLSGGLIELEEEEEEDKRLSLKGANAFGLGVGVITEPGDLLFVGGFE